MKIKRRIASFSLLALALGCRSFSSTPLSRTEQDNFVGDSNGLKTAQCRTRPTKGIPVTVKLTTHTDVIVKEDYYVEYDPENPAVVREPLQEIRMLRVETNDIQTDKVILVDFKRPAAGMLDTTMDFNEDQFFKKVQSSIQDETITESAKLLKTVIGLVRPQAASFTQSPTLNANRKMLTRVVAYQRFDVNDPAHEEQVEAFVSHHLSKCNQCGAPPNYDR